VFFPSQYEHSNAYTEEEHDQLLQTHLQFIINYEAEMAEELDNDSDDSEDSDGYKAQSDENIKEFNREKFSKKLKSKEKEVTMRQVRTQNKFQLKLKDKRERNEFFINKSLREGTYKCNQRKKDEKKIVFDMGYIDLNAQGDGFENIFPFYNRLSSYIYNFEIPNFKFSGSRLFVSQSFNDFYDNLKQFYYNQTTFSQRIKLNVFQYFCGMKTARIDFMFIINSIYNYFTKQVLMKRGVSIGNFTETTIIYLILLKRCPDWYTFLLNTQQYLSHFYENSIIGNIIDACKGVNFEFEFTKRFRESASDKLDSQGLCEFYQDLKSTYFSMKNFSSCEFTERFTALIAYAIKFGVIKSLKVKEFASEISGINFKKMNPSRTSAFLYIAESLFFLIDKIIQICEKRNFGLLFAQEDKVLKAEELFAKCVDGVKAYREDKLASASLTEHDLDVTLTETENFLKDQLKCVSLADRQYYSLKFQKISALKNEFNRERNNESLRERPFSFLFYGDSGVGKSTMLNYILKALYQTNNFEFNDKSIVSLNTSDKFQSEYRSHHITVVLDDIANVKPDFNQVSPLQIVIDIVNNQPKYALMAEADMKGKISFRPKIVVGTTNIKRLQAEVYSNNTTSILSRFEYIITVAVRPEFQEDNSKRIDANKVRLANSKDIWLFDVEYAREGNSSARSVFYTCDFDGIEMKGVPLGILIKFLNSKSLEFYSQQKILLERTAEMNEEMLCEHNNFNGICPDCEQLENQGIENAVRIVKDNSKTAVQKCKGIIEDVSRKVYTFKDNVSFVRKNTTLMYRVSHNVLRVIMAIMPFFTLTFALALARQYEVINKKKENFKQSLFCRSYILSPLIIAYFALSLYCMAYYSTSFVLGVNGLAILFVLLCWAYYYLCAASYIYIYTLEYNYANFKRKAFEKAHSVKQFVKKNYISFSLITVFITFIYYHRKAINRFFGFNDQGSYFSSENIPENEEDEHNPVQSKSYKDEARKEIPIRPYEIPIEELEPFYTEEDRQIIPDLWRKNPNPVILSHLDYSGPTMPQLEHRLGKSWLAFVEFMGENKQLKNRCNIMHLEKGLWIAPFHIVSQNYPYIRIITNDPNMISDNHTCRINTLSYKRVDQNSDIAILYLPGDCPRTSSMRYIPDVCPTVSSARLIYRDNNADIMSGCCSYLHFGNHKQTFKGIQYGSCPSAFYEWEHVTFKGLCGAILLANSKYPCILGMHIAGKDNKKSGCSVLLNSNVLKKAIEEYFDVTCSVLPLHSQGIPVLENREKGIRLMDKPRRKSPLHYLEPDDVVKYYGSHNGQLRKFKSNVVPTLICDSVAKHFEHPSIYAGPKNINSYLPWYTHMKSLSNLTSVCPNLLEKAYKDFHFTTHKFLENFNLKEKIFIISNEVNLAGEDGIPGFEPINLKASTGWPDCVPKSNIISLSDISVDGITCPRIAPDWVWEQVRKCEDELSQGRRIHLIHRCNLKDEPTKITKEKVRVFAGTPMIGLLLVRKYFLSICKFIMDHPIQFECGVGVNPYSNKWTKLTKYMLKYGEDRVIAGDYKLYDGTMSSRMTLAGMKFLIDIAIKAGYSSREITIMQGLATELCFPTYEFNGDFVEVSGSNPSGHSLTVFLNNIVNSLYLRYAYYEISNTKEDVPYFRDVVSVICYGDDNKMSVKRGFDWYNHTAIANSLEKYGIVYTMAEKDRESVPFISNLECNFLKRSSIWSDQYECYLAPLEMNTLFKILQSHLKSDFLNLTEQSKAAIDNVLREVFFHGLEEYQYMEQRLNMVLNDHYELKVMFEDGKVPTYQFYEEWFLRSYHPHLIKESSVETEMSRDDLKLAPQSFDCDDVTLDDHLLNAEIRSMDRLCHFINNSTLMCMPFLGLSSNLKALSGLMRLDGLDNCIANTKINKFTSVMGDSQAETVEFHDGDAQIVNTIEHYPDETFNLGHTEMCNLGDFLERPVVIYEFTWQSSVDYSDTFNPWLLFLQNKRVSNRMNNFYLLHSKLNVKFLINGNPFFYGRLMADYHPLYAVDNVTAWDPTVSANIIAASQRMHILLNPTCSKGGEMILPFLLNKNSGNIPNADVGSMGVIHIRQMQPLLSSSAATAVLNVSVLAWMDDVKMSVPTIAPTSTLTAQGDDEYENKVVSQTASNVKNIASRLTDIPFIAPYAMATKMIATMVEGVAKLFGYSKPLNIEPMTLVKPQYVGTLACTNDVDSCAKLTFDTKNELSIDSKTVGLSGKDELALKNIAMIQSYLTQFAWTQERVPNDVLFSSRVRPTLHPHSTYFYLPACAFAALPFRYWRGSMQFRFEIVCSDYHRGRLKIVYDPYFCSATPESNVQITKIVDIADTKEVVMNIGWSQPVPFLQTLALVTSNSGFSTSTAYTTAEDDYSNGVLTIYVLNELTVPGIVDAPISVNVYVNMCDDAEFACPEESNFSLLHYPESEPYSAQGDEMNDGDDQCADPTNTTATDIALNPINITDNTYKVFMGEQVASFRALLKRYVFHSVYKASLDATQDYCVSTIVTTNFPIYRGFLSTGTSGSGTYNDVYNTLLNYLTPAFLTVRGSLRSKYVLCGCPDAVSVRGMIKRATTDGSIETYSVTPIDLSDTDSLRTSFSDALIYGYNGMTMTILDKQPVMEAEFPFYYNRRFNSAKDRSFVYPSYSPGTGCHSVSSILPTTDFTTVVGMFYERYVSVGEDFLLAGFQGCPPITGVTVP
jgi:hypothetical protein